MTSKKFIRAIMTLLIMSVVIVAIKQVSKNGPAGKGYPTRAIKIIVPFKPGGGSDRIARVVDNFTEKEFGRKFIFQYKEGGGGHLGIGFLAKARSDGYTIGTYNTPDIALGPLTGTGQYSLDDFEIVGQVAFDPVVFVTNKENEYQDLKGFIEEAKSKPGKLSLGISGAKGGTHLSSLAMLDEQGVDIKIVLFASGSELASAVLGKQVDVGASGLTPFLGSISEVRVLATTGKERHPKVPDSKTMDEMGINMNIGTGRIFLTQKGLGKEKLERLRKGLKNIYNSEEFKEMMRKIGKDPAWADGDDVANNMKLFSKSAAVMIEKYNLK